MGDRGEESRSEDTWLLSTRSPKGDRGYAFDNELHDLIDNPSPRKLKSSLGFWDVYSMTITILLNAIFIYHGVMEVGSLISALILFGVAGFVTCCCVAVYIELSTFLPSAGGDYEYIRVAFGNMPGFTYAWMMYIFLQTCTTAMQGLTFSTHVSCKVFPDLEDKQACVPNQGHAIDSIKIRALAISGILLIVWLNCCSIKVVSHVQKVFAAMKGAMVAFIFVVSVNYAVHNPLVIRENIKADWSKLSIRQLNNIVISLLWSVNGFNSIVCLSEEVVSPRKNMRGGLFYGMLSIMGAYTVLLVSYFCVLDPKRIDLRTGVAAAVVRTTMGERSESVFSVLVALSTLACLNAGIATGGRWLYAVARNKQMPSIVASIGKTTNAPYAAVVMQGLWPAICLLFKGPSFDDLLALFGQSSWYFYAMIACAYLKFQWTLHSQIWTRKRIVTSGCALVVFSASLVMMAISFYETPFMTIISMCFVLSSIPAFHLCEYLKYRKLLT